MQKKTKNLILLFSECVVFGACMVLFLILHFTKRADAYADIVYIAFIASAFGWLLVQEFWLKAWDNVVHYKMFKSAYIPTKADKASVPKRRRGIGWVLLLWAAYLLFVFLLRYSGILTWQLFLAGASVMFILNAVFSRWVCLLSVLFLKNENNCCKNCGINSWDYAIFSSALLFAPYINNAATVLNVVILLLSAVKLVAWEVTYRKHPYRFYARTNATLACGNCLKQCKRKKCGAKKLIKNPKTKHPENV